MSEGSDLEYYKEHLKKARKNETKEMVYSVDWPQGEVMICQMMKAAKKTFNCVVDRDQFFEKWDKSEKIQKQIRKMLDRGVKVNILLNGVSEEDLGEKKLIYAAGVDKAGKGWTATHIVVHPEIQHVLFDYDVLEAYLENQEKYICLTE